MSVLAILFVTLAVYRFTRENIVIVLGLLIVPLCLNLLYTVLLTDNNLLISTKFFITLITVGLAYFVTVNRYALKWFIWLNLLQAIVLISIFLFVLFYIGPKEYLPIRFFFIEKDWGDIYTYNGYFFRIQIRGSALLLVSIILTNETNLIKGKYLTLTILIIGLILAGNFAFLIAGALYIIYCILRIEGKRSNNAYLLIILIFVIAGVFLSPYISEYVVSTLESKQESSIGARNDQAAYLVKDVFENPFSTMLGQGLGNTLQVKSSFRDYTTSTYYELQTLYIFNQLGVLFFLIYLLYHIFMVIQRWGKAKNVIFITYLIYVCYAITNPYIFDTNHFIIIVVLNSWVNTIKCDAIY
ncbi:hypothetical protein WG906_14295 [Pedobacter sp. P351]|uniref:hypothetical protein n=1 Tax=Pedobacter superstes TaxID=3133441 RepID=UPI0030B300BB